MKVEIVDNKIIIDGEGFDWVVEEADFLKAKTQCLEDPESKYNYLATIQQHFIDSFSAFIGKKTTLKEINELLNDHN